MVLYGSIRGHCSGALLKEDAARWCTGRCRWGVVAGKYWGVTVRFDFVMEDWASMLGCMVGGKEIPWGGFRRWCREVLLRGNVEWRNCGMMPGCDRNVLCSRWNDGK